MGTVVKYDNIFQYNESRGVETLHPLVSVIDFSKAEPIPPGHYRHCFGFYAVFLKDVKCGDLRYGRNYYDYQEGTLVFMAPGQVVEVEVKDKPQVPPKGRALLFHPDLLRGTSLGRNIAGYTFFSYEVNEALHLSEQERQVVMDCLQNIQSELKHAIDKHSRTLIVSNIELLLNYTHGFTNGSSSRATTSTATCWPDSSVCWATISQETAPSGTACRRCAGAPSSCTCRRTISATW